MLWLLLITAVSATPTWFANDATLTIPDPGQPDECVTLVTLRSPVRDELRGVRGSCDLFGIYNQPKPIVQLLDGTFSRKVQVCMPDTLVVPDSAVCSINDNTGAWLFDYYVDFVDGF